MPTNRVPVYTSQLPPTPVTPEMRESILAEAKKQGDSIAEIQRRAFSLFLSKNCVKATAQSSISTEAAEQTKKTIERG